MLPYLTDEQAALGARARAWAEKNLSAPPAEADVEDQARSFVAALGRAGWLGYLAPKNFGGADEAISLRALCVLREEFARVSPLADTMFAVQALGSYPIALAGSEEQKRRYLPALARGEKIAAFALTEPEAGSDAASIRTRAEKRGGDYVLTGIKSFVSNAGLAASTVVFASTDPEKKAEGLTAFIIDAGSRGFAVREKLRLIAPHPIGVVALNDCVVPGANRLGREGDGMKIALRTLDALRPTVGAAAVGLAQRALEEAIGYSKQRRQFGRALADFQATQFKLADMATELDAARLLVYRAAWEHDGGGPSKRSVSMAKLFATEAAQRIVDAALQIHGGLGVVADSAVARLYCAVRALRIYEGTSEIQRLVIARELLKD
jgi:acyl-CoA dehydrogenase